MSTAATTKCGAGRASHQQTSPSLPLRGARELLKGRGCAPCAGRCPPRGWQQGREQPTACGTVNIVWRREIRVRGERLVGQEWVRKRGTQERQQTGGGATKTHRTREPHQEGRGLAQQTRRKGAARQERQPGQGTRTEGMGECAHERQRQQRGWPGQPAPSLPGARATPAQLASDGGCLPQPRWATGPGAHQGQTSREGERDIWWTPRTTRGGAGHLGLTHTRKHSEAGYGRPVDRGAWAAQTVNDPGNNQHNLNTPHTGRH